MKVKPLVDTSPKDTPVNMRPSPIVPLTLAVSVIIWIDDHLMWVTAFNLGYRYEGGSGISSKLLPDVLISISP